MRSVTININLRCPLSCDHCSLAFSEGDHGSMYRIEPAKLEAIVAAVDRTTYQMVLLAGGEPSLDVPLIQAGARAARRAGLLCAVVTAPIWGASTERALRFVREISDVGLLVLSCDEYHLKSLSWGHYRRAFHAARLAKIPVSIQTVYARQDERERVLSALRREGIDAHVHATRAVATGNATALIDSSDARRCIETQQDIRTLPRTCVLGNSLIDDRFCIHGCCWAATARLSPFSEKASLETLPAAFERLEQRPLFRRVRDHGFVDALDEPAGEAVLEWARGRTFATECDLCLAAMEPAHQSLWREIAHAAPPGVVDAALRLSSPTATSDSESRSMEELK